MELSVSLTFDDQVNKFPAVVPDVLELGATTNRLKFPTSSVLELGRVLEAMKAEDTLRFIFGAAYTTAVHRLFTAFVEGTKVKAKLVALQQVYRPETTVKCRQGSAIPGTYIPTIQCETFEIAKKDWSRIVQLIMDVKITQFIPIPAPEGSLGRYLVDLEVSGWV
ncbi:MAG: hypothetical protein ACRC33_09885 [Gemmataceae bacterium]